MCLAETYVYVGCLRFAWVATYADRKETVQTLAARPAIASLPRTRSWKIREAFLQLLDRMAESMVVDLRRMM
jgi:hypothetical protein